MNTATIITAQTPTTGLTHAPTADPYTIHAQAFLTPGQDYLSIIGVTTSGNGVKDTIRSAVRNTTGGHWPAGRVTVNLSPAAAPKTANASSAAIAAAILTAMGEAPAHPAGRTAILGQAKADGTLDGAAITDGIIDHLASQGITRIIIPTDTPIDPARHPGTATTRATTLTGVIAALRNLAAPPATVRDIAAMVHLIDGRLLHACRDAGFRPHEGIYRIGDDGYVTEREFENAFADQPAWARDAYMAEGNGADPDDILDAIHDDPDDWATAIDIPDDAVFRTEADEHGHC